MANHSFNVKIAEQYGVDEAIIIELMYWWIHHNECEEEETMLHNDKMWCRCSANGFAKFIPYMNPQKIGRVLRSLEKKHKAIIVGNFNIKATNQTKWYTFTDEFREVLKDAGYEFSKIKTPIFKNENSYNSIINNPIKDNNIKDNKKRLSNDNQKEPDSLFVSFWEKYGYKRGRKDAIAAWKKLSKQDKEDAIKAISVYKEDCRVCDRQMRQPSVYLNKRTWEDDFENNGRLSKKEEKEESETTYPDGMTKEKWTDITLWLCNNCRKIAGRISPNDFAEMKERCKGDSKLLSQILIDINDFVEQSGQADVKGKFEEYLTKNLSHE